MSMWTHVIGAIHIDTFCQMGNIELFDELTAKGVECDLDEIEKDIIERDYRDMHREVAPLKQAEDAILVDSSYMTIEEVVDRIVGIAKEK